MINFISIWKEMRVIMEEALKMEGWSEWKAWEFRDLVDDFLKALLLIFEG